MIATGWNESWPKSGIEKTELLLWHRCRSRFPRFRYYQKSSISKCSRKEYRREQSAYAHTTAVRRIIMPDEALSAADMRLVLPHLTGSRLSSRTISLCKQSLRAPAHSSPCVQS
jgi:hypothetical protein